MTINHHNRRVSPILCILDAVFIIMLLTALVAWFLDDLKLHAGSMCVSIECWELSALISIAAIAWRFAVRKRKASRGVRAGGLWEKTLFRRITFSIGATFSFFLVFEGILALVGFEAALPPIVIVGENDTVVQTSDAIIPDPKLMFRLNPGSEFRGRRVNSLGFLGREIERTKKKGIMRVMCMGDSVSAQGAPPYSGYLHSMLTNRPPTDSEWEAFNVAVHGYTSVQGLRVFQELGHALQPDIVTVMYGWNDHWLCPVPDIGRMAVEMGWFRGGVLKALQRKRFGQLLSLADGRSDAGSVAGSPRVSRVSPELYRRTLTRLVGEIRSANATPVLITAPRAARLTRALVHLRQIESVESGIRNHDLYNGVAREVARANAVPMLDLASQPMNAELAPFFARDGIHFGNPTGRIYMAEAIYRTIKEIVD